jgi:hypothetical protein
MGLNQKLKIVSEACIRDSENQFTVKQELINSGSRAVNTLNYKLKLDSKGFLEIISYWITENSYIFGVAACIVVLLSLWFIILE